MCQLSYSIIASILLAVVEYLFVFFYGQFRGYLSPRLSHVGVNLVEKIPSCVTSKRILNVFEMRVQAKYESHCVNPQHAHSFATLPVSKA